MKSRHANSLCKEVFFYIYKFSSIVSMAFKNSFRFHVWNQLYLNAACPMRTSVKQIFSKETNNSNNNEKTNNHKNSENSHRKYIWIKFKFSRIIVNINIYSSSFFVEPSLLPKRLKLNFFKICHQQIEWIGLILDNFLIWDTIVS